MTGLEWVAAGLLAAAAVYAVLARALTVFSGAKLEDLIKMHQEGQGKLKTRAEVLFKSGEMLARSAHAALDLLAAGFLVVATVATLKARSGTEWQVLGAWLAGWLVFIELVPYFLGEAVAEKVSLWCAGAGRVLLVPFLPFGKFVSWFAGVIDRLRGVSAGAAEEIEEEIRAIVAEGRSEGAIERREGEMIESVLRLRDADVAEIMTPRTEMVCIPDTADLEEAIKIAWEAGHSRLPVYEGNRDNIVGIFYAKDVLKYWGGETPPGLRDIIRKPHFIPESRKVSGLLEELKRENVHIAVAIDEYGGTAGLVTIEDILEEIVGEIQDEFDRKAEPTWRRLPGGAVQTDARVRVDDINHGTAMDLPESEDYDTVGGLVISHLGRIPKPGEKLEVNGVRIEVLDADARQVKRLKVSRPGRGEK